MDVGEGAEVDVAEVARERLVEAEVLPLLLGLSRARASAGCLAVLLVLAGMVAIPAAATAVLFLFPAVAVSWARFLGLVLAMVLATSALVAVAGRARRALADRAAARRLGRYNSAEAARARRLIAELDGSSLGAAPVQGGRATEPLLARTRGVVRLSYLVEHRAPLPLRRTAGRLAREIATTRLLGLALWAHDGREARCLASFVSALSGAGEQLDAGSHLERFAELPAEDLAEALEAALGLPVEDRSARYGLP